MRSESSSIRLLPVEVQAQIKSSVAITSLNDVVIGLLENALDAGATTVEIRVDYVKGYCSIVDNGFGIAAEDLGITGQLGVLHCTSKLDSSGPTYGKYGEFLFHLAALSILVITSRQKSAQAERSITFHRANPIAWSLSQEPQSEVLHNQQGTKVVVGNLFGDLPVRFKHNASRFENVSTAEMEFKALKRRVVSLLLASGRDLDLKLTEARTKQKYAHYHKPNDQAVFEIEKICSILQHAGYIAYSDVGSWRAASARTGTVQIRAAMSLIPAPSQHVQFISVGHHPLRSSHRASLFYDEINSIFELSTFGTEEAGLDVSDGEIERRKMDRPFKKDPNTIRRLNGQKKGVDRWPMFCVRIDFKTNETSSVLEETQDESIAADQWIEKVRGLMRSMIFEFLSTHNFYPRASRGKRPRQSNLDLRAIHKPAIQPEIHSETRSEPGLYQAMTQPAVDNRTFRNWSRIKVGKQNTFSDLTFDLPMSKGQSSSSALSTISGPQSQLAKVELAQTALGQLELQSLSDADIMMLLEDLSNDNDCRNGSISCSIGPDVGQMNHIQGDYLGFVPSTGTTGPAALAEDTLLWTNPSNGHDVRLNARTGFIVPNFGDSYTEPGVTSGSISSLAWRPHSAPAASRPAYKERSLTITRSRDLLIRSILDNDLVNTFRKLEEPIPSINMTEPDEATYLHVNRKPMYSCGHTDNQLSDYFTDPTTSFELKLSKANIEGAEVLAQVDQKFVLLRAQMTDHAAEGEDVLILVDQHAADERIKVEELYRKLCTVSRVSLMKPIVFEVSDVELALFEARKGHFLEWGIIYDHRMVSSSSSLQSSSLAVPYLPAIAGQVVVRVLPELIVERCRLEPKVLIDLLRREIWFDKGKQPLAIEGSNENSWISKLPRCPQGLLEMITSRACRSAVMFNDILSPEQCEALIRRLAMCAFPFQCAHGRPTMVVLPKLGQTGNWDQTRRDRRGPFGQVFKEWQDSGRELNLV